MTTKKAATMNLKGNDYAKVAERLKLFREDNPRGKQESGYEVEVDGSLVFTVWLWKDKTDLLELMKGGITDKDVLRSSADANGTAKGAVEGQAKDFEKLESIALGRALANLGYLASGEIASSEEMEKFLNYQQDKIDEVVGHIKTTETLEELKKYFMSLGPLMAEDAVIKAKDAKKVELTKS